MKITIHTDNHIQGRQDVAESIENMVQTAIGHLGEFLTSIHVHLSDENGAKGGEDKRCLLEANPKGSSAIAVSHTAATVRDAVEEASDKLVVMLEKLHDKRIDRQHRPNKIKMEQ